MKMFLTIVGAGLILAFVLSTLYGDPKQRKKK